MAQSLGLSVHLGVIMLHFINELSSVSPLPDSMRMAVRQGKHGAHLSALLKAASGDGGSREGRE